MVTKTNFRMIDGEIVNVLDYGAVGDGVVDDTSAIQTAINEDKPIFLPEGYTFKTTGLLPTENTKVLGTGKFLYVRGGRVPDAIVPTSSMQPKHDTYMYTWEIIHLEEMLQIKSLGFTTINHYGYYTNGGSIAQTLRAAKAVGMKVILNSQTDTPTLPYDDHECVVGYSLFDEPTQHGVYQAAQDVRIAAHRLLTNKDLCTVDNADNGVGQSGIWSENWDKFFVDVYADASLTYAESKGICHKVWEQIKIACPRAELIPCLGLFTNPQFSNKDKQLELAKAFYHYSQNDEFATFGWDAHRQDATFTGDISYDTDFQELAKDLTTRTSKRYQVNTLLFSPADLTTQPMSELVRAYYPHYSTVANVLPFSVQDVGSAQDERHSTFQDKGMAMRNNGGLFATNLLTKDYYVMNIQFRNWVDGGTGTLKLQAFDDDFFHVDTELESVTLSDNNSVGRTGSSKSGFSLGFKLSSSTSSSSAWKFFDGYLITSTWRD